MDFTGERYIPLLNGIIKYEHLHRYAMCLELVVGKSVLDIASGEGYGSALLAKAASSVIGVDIDNISIEYSKSQYSHHKNLEFLQGSCESIPLPDNSVDVVTSFETIEHHDKHEEMMQEIKRVLKPGGLLIISSPNRLTYSDEPNNSNPFHVKELYYDELSDLLSKYFNYSQIYGQKLATSSFIYPLENASETSLKIYKGNIDNLTQKSCILKSPLYFVAICSDIAETTQMAIDSLYIDESDDLLKAMECGWNETKQMLYSSQIQIQQAQLNLERSQSQILPLQAELDLSKSELQQTQAKLDMAKSELQQTQSELQLTQSELQLTQSGLQQVQAELQVHIANISAMKSSKFWKLRTAWLSLKRTIGIKTDG
jgi:ubiquinone/menaquinone biosynthesis C-methylase UbiE